MKMIAHFKKESVWALMAVLPLFASCGEEALGLGNVGEDRTGEFKELTGDTHWIYEQMNAYYLWYAQMPQYSDENDYKVFFKTPEQFFKTLLWSGDKYSYIEVDEEASTRSIDLQSTYGFDFALYNDPVTGSSTKNYARVLYVLPGSPAAEIGLKRGDWIARIGDKQLTNKTYTGLINGGETSIVRTKLNYDRPDSLYWEREDTLTLPASRHMEDDPFYVDSVYHFQGGRTVAYLMYNRFSTGPEDTGAETEYNDRMRQIFARFKGENPTDFILDMRYNPGGYLSCAQVLASLLAPEEAFGETFCALEFNDKNSDSNVTYPFRKDLTGGANLNLGRIYIITSNLTASASESIINGLIPFMGAENVIMVGETTEGKNLASFTLDKPAYGLTLHPIVAKVYNALGQSDYSNGFAPTYEVSELSFVNDLCPLGDIDEIMLNNTLSLILTGVLPGTEPTEQTRATVAGNILSQPVYNSIERKRVEGVRITEF